MPHFEPSIFNQLQLYRPACPKCHTPMLLTRIEPAPEPGCDLRTFDCVACGLSETAKVAHRA